MTASTIQSVSVWLDETAPQQGAFRDALEWASRLGLPLHAFVLPDENLRRRRRERWEPLEVGPDRAGLLAACEAACGRTDVPWQYTLWQGPVSRAVGAFLHPTSLCVFGSALRDIVKGELLRQSLRRGAVFPVLVCPPTVEPLARILVLNQASDSASLFLNSVADLCGALGVAPVVLTVARTEREAMSQQETARQTWQTRGLFADFDALIGGDLQTAVTSVLRWRRCTHLFAERRGPRPWWRRLRGESLWRLLGLSDSFRILALPALTQLADRSAPVGQHAAGAL